MKRSVSQMANYSDRIQSLTPQQQELLRLRVEQRKEHKPAAPMPPSSGKALGKVDFSLFFFSADGTVVGQDRYKLLLEAARFADQHGFQAIWTPERHFQVFGGLYPNPAVLSAALAMITEHVQIRAGSVVLPLHSPVRVAEDWSQVDILSRGREGISFATGWHEHDYVIAPDAYESRREIMFRDIAIVRRLWAGEAIELPGPRGTNITVKTLPRPIQPELPFWVTVSSPKTWVRAGAIGSHVLTAFVGGEWDDLRQSIAAYRRARLENGYNPDTGIVSLMLHTYVGTDMEEIRARVREPMKRYLQNFLDQFRPLAKHDPIDANSHEMQSLLDFAFERYFESRSLLGTQTKCLEILSVLASLGVNEAACLVDFGLDYESTMKGLEHLSEMRRFLASNAVAGIEGSSDGC